jgi:hypothetical protein
MADDESEGGGADKILWIIIAIVAILVIVLGLSRGPFDPTFLNLEFIFQGMLRGVQGFVDFFVTNHVPLWFRVIVSFLSVGLITLIIYVTVRLFEMESSHAEHVYHKTDHAEGAHHDTEYGGGEMGKLFGRITQNMDRSAEIEKPGRARWEVVQDYIASPNEADWRLAIIEADALLDQVIEGQGYPGSSLGERLNSAGMGSFQTYQDAWEAHKVRNRIAHDGSEFVITYRDAQRAISQYENVFREFKYI